MIQTLIAEGDGATRLGMRSLLDTLALSLEIDEARNSAELLMRLDAGYYELIVIDPAILCTAPESCIRYLRDTAPWSDVLVFTELDELIHGVGTIRSGAKGYVMKTCGADQFVAAVRRVGSGKRYLSTALAAEFATGIRQYDNRIKPHEALGQREFQVFAMVVCRMTVVEIAHVLQLDTDTVNAFKTSAMHKLQADTHEDVNQYALAQGLLPDCQAMSSVLWSERHGATLMDRALPI